MALEPRLMPGVAAEVRSLRSTASTPSLRSREGTPVGRMEPPGGNVKVVVRVRGFLPRGTHGREVRGARLTGVQKSSAVLNA